MKYQGTIEKKDNSTFLAFTRKNGQVKNLDLGYVKGGALAEQCLAKLYDFHQCDDEFKEDDTIEIPEVGTFVARSFHILPADEDTKLAVQGVSKEYPYRVCYEGIDGNHSDQFTSLANAAGYVKSRWEGIDYMDGAAAFHNDYGRFHMYGFELKDIGTFTGSRETDDLDFKFRSHQELANNG